ncbi:MAG: T9SS C-terminal target domain-containing protein [Balneolaceae bacterium]|nr:MAG: T9SS C-terminal target domain-containing protein [Balneolaceae bacterium]
MPGESRTIRVKELRFFDSDPRKYIGLFEYCDIDCGESIARFDSHESGGTFQEFDHLLIAGDENSRVYVRHNNSTTLMSYDGGITWPDFFEINSGSVPDSVILDFPLIALSPFDPDLMFGMDPNAESVLLRSTDAGVSGEPVEAPFRLLDRHIYFDSDDQHIYMAGIQDEVIALYTSPQRGEPGSWQFIRTLESKPVIHSDRGNHGHLYLVEGNTILQSTDFGDTFSPYHENTLPVTGLYKGQANDELFFTTDERLYALRSGEEELLREIRVSPDPELQQTWFDLSVGTVRYYGDCAMYGPCLTAYGVNGLAIETVIGEMEIDGKTWSEVAWAQTMNYWPEDPDAFVVYDTAFYRTEGPLLFMHTDQGDSLILDFGITEGDSLAVHFSRFIPEGLDMETYVGLYYRLEGMPTLALVDTTITFPDGTDRRIVWGDDSVAIHQNVLYPPDKEAFMNSFRVFWDTLPLPFYDTRYKPFYYVEGMGAMHTPINHRHMNMVGYSSPDGAVYGNKHDDFLVSVPGEPQRPAAFTLHQNYPNPFNLSTVIRYSIPDAAGVKLIVYDITGREVATLVNQSQQAGQYTVQFDGTNLASGVYIYLLQTDGIARQTRKMILLK